MKKSNQSPLFYKAFFAIENVVKPIEGITDGQLWNGWSVPYFDKKTVIGIIEDYNKNSVNYDPVSRLEFDEEKNCVVYHEEGECYEASTCFFEGVTYYSATDGWVWTEWESVEQYNKVWNETENHN